MTSSVIVSKPPLSAVAVGSQSPCTLRHLLDAIAKIHRQKQCPSVVRIVRAVRQALQFEIDSDEVLRQLDAEAENGSLVRIENNGVVSFKDASKQLPTAAVGVQKQTSTISRSTGSEPPTKKIAVASNSTSTQPRLAPALPDQQARKNNVTPKYYGGVSEVEESSRQRCTSDQRTASFWSDYSGASTATPIRHSERSSSRFPGDVDHYSGIGVGPEMFDPAMNAAALWAQNVCDASMMRSPSMMPSNRTAMESLSWYVGRASGWPQPGPNNFGMPTSDMICNNIANYSASPWPMTGVNVAAAGSMYQSMASPPLYPSVYQQNVAAAMGQMYPAANLSYQKDPTFWTTTDPWAGRGVVPTEAVIDQWSRSACETYGPSLSQEQSHQILETGMQSVRGCSNLTSPSLPSQERSGNKLTSSLSSPRKRPLTALPSEQRALEEVQQQRAQQQQPTPIITFHPENGYEQFVNSTPVAPLRLQHPSNLAVDNRTAAVVNDRSNAMSRSGGRSYRVDQATQSAAYPTTDRSTKQLSEQFTNSSVNDSLRIHNDSRHPSLTPQQTYDSYGLSIGKAQNCFLEMAPSTMPKQSSESCTRGRTEAIGKLVQKSNGVELPNSAVSLTSNVRNDYSGKLQCKSTADSISTPSLKIADLPVTRGGETNFAESCIASSSGIVSNIISEPCSGDLPEVVMETCKIDLLNQRRDDTDLNSKAQTLNDGHVVDQVRKDTGTNSNDVPFEQLEIDRPVDKELINHQLFGNDIGSSDNRVEADTQVTEAQKDKCSNTDSSEYNIQSDDVSVALCSEIKTSESNILKSEEDAHHDIVASCNGAASTNTGASSKCELSEMHTSDQVNPAKHLIEPEVSACNIAVCGENKTSESNTLQSEEDAHHNIVASCIGAASTDMGATSKCEFSEQHTSDKVNPAKHPIERDVSTCNAAILSQLSKQPLDSIPIPSLTESDAANFSPWVEMVSTAVRSHQARNGRSSTSRRGGSSLEDIEAYIRSSYRISPNASAQLPRRVRTSCRKAVEAGHLKVYRNLYYPTNDRGKGAATKSLCQTLPSVDPVVELCADTAISMDLQASSDLIPSAKTEISVSVSTAALKSTECLMLDAPLGKPPPTVATPPVEAPTAATDVIVGSDRGEETDVRCSGDELVSQDDCSFSLTATSAAAAAGAAVAADVSATGEAITSSSLSTSLLQTAVNDAAMVTELSVSSHEVSLHLVRESDVCEDVRSLSGKRKLNDSSVEDDSSGEDEAVTDGSVIREILPSSDDNDNECNADTPQEIQHTTLSAENLSNVPTTDSDMSASCTDRDNKITDTNTCDTNQDTGMHLNTVLHNIAATEAVVATVTDIRNTDNLTKCDQTPTESCKNSVTDVRSTLETTNMLDGKTVSVTCRLSQLSRLHPRGLVDGLSQFFTPSNKRSSRVSQNVVRQSNGISTEASSLLINEQTAEQRLIPETQSFRQCDRGSLDSARATSDKVLQTGTDYSARNIALQRIRLSHKKRSHKKKLLSRVVTTVSNEDGKPIEPLLGDNRRIHPAMESGSNIENQRIKRRTGARENGSARAREQLIDGLSHFFAATGKRRSCVVGRAPPSGNSPWSNSSREKDINEADDGDSAFSTSPFFLAASTDSCVQLKALNNYNDRSRAASDSRFTYGADSNASLERIDVTHSSSRSDDSLGLCKSVFTSNITGALLHTTTMGRNALETLSIVASQAKLAHVDNYSKHGLQPVTSQSAGCQSFHMSSKIRSRSVRSESPLLLSSITTKPETVQSDSSHRAACCLDVDSKPALQVTSLSPRFNSTNMDHLKQSQAVKTESLESNGRRVKDEKSSVELVDQLKEENAEENAELDVAVPNIIHYDQILFRKSQKIATERQLVSRELLAEMRKRTPLSIQFGVDEIICPALAVCPVDFAGFSKLFVCESCLKCLKSRDCLKRHAERYGCENVVRPPGDEIYRHEALSIFEINAETCTTVAYCQNICLLAALFLDTCELISPEDLQSHIFYVITQNDGDNRFRAAAFFARGTFQDKGIEPSFIFVLPTHHSKGYEQIALDCCSYLYCNAGGKLATVADAEEARRKIDALRDAIICLDLNCFKLVTSTRNIFSWSPLLPVAWSQSGVRGSKSRRIESYIFRKGIRISIAELRAQEIKRLKMDNDVDRSHSRVESSRRTTIATSDIELSPLQILKKKIETSFIAGESCKVLDMATENSSISEQKRIFHEDITNLAHSVSEASTWQRPTSDLCTMDSNQSNATGQSESPSKQVAKPQMCSISCQTDPYDSTDSSSEGSDSESDSDISSRSSASRKSSERSKADPVTTVTISASTVNSVNIELDEHPAVELTVKNNVELEKDISAFEKGAKSCVNLGNENIGASEAMDKDICSIGTGSTAALRETVCNPTLSCEEKICDRLPQVDFVTDVLQENKLSSKVMNDGDNLTLCAVATNNTSVHQEDEELVEEVREKEGEKVEESNADYQNTVDRNQMVQNRHTLCSKSSNDFDDVEYTDDGYIYETGGLATIHAMESPMSLNSSAMSVNSNPDLSGTGGSSASQSGGIHLSSNHAVYQDCSQTIYGMCSTGSSLYQGQTAMSHMASPATDCSQMTSPASNQSFQMPSQSPVVISGGGYGVSSDYCDNQSPSAASGTGGTTFKMPSGQNDDGRYSYASGFGVAVASPADGGQISYCRSFMDNSPGGQFSVINQNSPGSNNNISCIVYNNMPTPSPTNSSSRSFQMASPNSFHVQQQQTPQVQQQMYDRSCPSAPALTYPHGIPQPLDPDTGRLVDDPQLCRMTSVMGSNPWQSNYSVQIPDDYSHIKFHSRGEEMDSQHGGYRIPPTELIMIEEGRQHRLQQQAQQQHGLLAVPPAAGPKAQIPLNNNIKHHHHHHRRSGSSSSKLGKGSGLSPSRSHSVAPNVTIQPGTNMITSYNVLNMNVSAGNVLADYRQYGPPPNGYMAAANGSFMSQGGGMSGSSGRGHQGLNIYQHHQSDMGFAPQSQPPHHRGGMYAAAAATYGYINGAIAAQQSFNTILR